MAQSVYGEGKEELKVSVEKEGAASTQVLSHSQGATTHGMLLPGHTSCLATCETQGMSLSSNLSPVVL